MKAIDRYFKSIGIKNELKDIFDVNRLIKKHLQSLYFCNIPVLLDEEISLDLDDIVNKMVDQKKGGYCFEHNKLIYEALHYSGFEVKALFARVLNNQNIDVPKTHRFTLLTYKGEKYVIDAGFSFMSPNSAIKFASTPTKTIFQRDYIVKKVDANNFELAMVRQNGLYSLYSFDLEEYNEKDFERGHLYSSRHKNANFVNNLVLSKITDAKIQSLKNNTYHQIFKESKEEKIITNQEELSTILRDELDYSISDENLKYLFDTFVKGRPTK